MQALLFEVTPNEGHEEHYFRHADKLRPILMEQDGLIDIERFKSQTHTDVILSHSIWQDEASLARWRTNGEHHKSQTAGRYKHFKDYRIRIAHVIQQYDESTELREWPRESLYNNSEASSDRYVVITRTNEQPKHLTCGVFKSVTNVNSFVIVQEFDSEDDGRSEIARAQKDPHSTSALLGVVSRDYGMHNRTEAPQFFKPV